MPHRLRCTLAALAALAATCAGPALAGPLADPTRPPAALAAPGGMAAAALPHKANLDTARAIAAAARAAEPPPAPAVVQGVQVTANGTATALVDGKAVKVGDTLDGRAVLAIDAQGLLVKGARGPERLWLLGGAPKQAAGSITASQWTRYQGAQPATAEGTASGTEPTVNSAVSPLPQAPAERQSLPGPQARTTTSAMPTTTPVSLAGRTTP